MSKSENKLKLYEKLLKELYLAYCLSSKDMQAVEKEQIARRVCKILQIK